MSEPTISAEAQALWSRLRTTGCAHWREGVGEHCSECAPTEIQAALDRARAEGARAERRRLGKLGQDQLRAALRKGKP